MSERLRVRRYGRTLVGVVAIAALAGLIVASTGSAANRPELSGSDGLFNPAWTPLGVSGAAQTLMVQLAGVPAAPSVQARIAYFSSRVRRSDAPYSSRGTLTQYRLRITPPKSTSIALRATRFAVLLRMS